MKTYEQRVRAYEREGMTTSDAQGVADAEDMKAGGKQDHTPRPWRYDGHGVNDSSGERIATMAAESHIDGRTRNARRDHDGNLIAAAPELLAALEQFLEAQDSPAPRDLLTLAAIRASAAIAKAKGE